MDKWKEILYKLIYNDKLPYDTIGKMYNCTGGNISKYQEEGFTNLEICKKLNISEYLLYKFF